LFDHYGATLSASQLHRPVTERTSTQKQLSVYRYSANPIDHREHESATRFQRPQTAIGSWEMPGPAASIENAKPGAQRDFARLE
jgi:hypothetical protein